jgi:hypothetical protein
MRNANILPASCLWQNDCYSTYEAGVSRRLKKKKKTQCGYEFPGTMLLHVLKGTTGLDHRSRDTSLHVSTCTNYDFKALTKVIWKLWRR